MAKRILVINPFGIGDVLFSTPFVSALKKVFSGSYIGYICNIRTKEVLETNPEISEIFVFERDGYRVLWRESRTACIRKLFRFWHEIKNRRFDTVFDLSLGKEYAFFCWLVGIKDRRGFDYKSRGRFLTRKIKFSGFNDKHVINYYFDLFTPAELVVAEEGKARETRLVITDADNSRAEVFLEQNGIGGGERLAGVVPGGGASFGARDADYKRWSPDKFIKLINKISSVDAVPVLLGGPDEEELMKSIRSRVNSRCPLALGLSIRESAALIKRCAMIICNDSGLLRVAISQNVPTVSIFGSTDEKVYSPYPPSEKHAVVTAGDVGCRPCYRNFKLPECHTKKCLDEITVDSVFGEVLKFIKRNG